VGLQQYWDERQAPSTPMLVVLREPTGYRTCTQGDAVPGAALDLVCRQYASGSASKTLAGTITATTGMACTIAGTIAHRMLRAGPRSGGSVYAFGHPSGIIHVDAVGRLQDGEYRAERSVIQRTARRLAEGVAYLKDA
jgi:2-methylaconitate cis-trans-isomerase PrpF